LLGQRAAVRAVGWSRSSNVEQGQALHSTKSYSAPAEVALRGTSRAVPEAEGPPWAPG